MVEQFVAGESQGLQILGFFAWWSIHGLRVRKADLAQIMKDLGFTYTLKDTPLRGTFLEAIRIVKAAHAAEGLLIRQIRKDSGEYTFGLVDESIDKANAHLGYSHTATVKFYPVTGVLSCDNTGHALWPLVCAAYRELQEFYSADNMRAILFDVLKDAHLVSVRQNGGIYFIPIQYQGLVDKIEKLLERIGNSYLSVAPQVDLESTRKSIYKAFISGLRDKIAQYKADLSEDGLSQKAALKNRLMEFRDLQKEIEFYSDVLHFQASELSEELVTLTEQVKAKLFN